MGIRIIYTFLILCCTSYAEVVKLSPCARWNRTGVTLAGTGEAGNTTRQLFDPKGIFILKQTNVLYVADSKNNRIQMFSLNQSSSDGVTVASTNSDPHYIYVDDDDGDEPTIYVSLPFENRVEKWVNGSSSGEQVGEECLICTGVSVDQEKNVYMVDSQRSCVFKWSPQTKTMKVVAGQEGIFGSTADHLFLPGDIYLDRNTSSLYLTDPPNGRIQKWLKDEKEGITVAGLGVDHEIDNDALLGSPEGLLIDDETNVVFVADQYGHRIQRWLPGASKGDTIAGGKDSGDAADQLNKPFDLAFDNERNLYVSDYNNHRIQFFALIDNHPCSETSTTTSVVETATTQPASPPPTVTTTINTTITTATTTTNRAVSSQWGRHSRATMFITTLSIILWMNMKNIDQLR